MFYNTVIIVRYTVSLKLTLLFPIEARHQIEACPPFQFKINA